MNHRIFAQACNRKEKNSLDIRNILDYCDRLYKAKNKPVIFKK